MGLTFADGRERDFEIPGKLAMRPAPEALGDIGRHRASRRSQVIAKSAIVFEAAACR
jgi:hypothetical protein